MSEIVESLIGVGQGIGRDAGPDLGIGGYFEKFLAVFAPKIGDRT
jgi:hypothetical protein